jgi:hypothetical protein
MVLTRSFRGAWFDQSGRDQSGHDKSSPESGSQLYLQLSAGQARAGQNLRFDTKTGGAAETGKYDYPRRQMLDVSVKQVTDDYDKEGDPNGELCVYDDKTGNLLWKRKFGKDAPAVRQYEPGILVFSLAMEGETAWDEITHSSKVIKTSDETRNEHRGLLTELVDSQTGAVLRQLVSPEASADRWFQLRTSGSDDRGSAAFGNWIVVHGRHNDNTVYDALTGARLMAFWGRAIAGDSRMGLIAARNREQELIVYQAATAREVLHVTLDTAVQAAQFLPENKQLLVVTSNQRVYKLDLSGGTVLQASER